MNGIVFDVKLKTRSYSEFNKTITQSNQEFLPINPKG